MIDDIKALGNIASRHSIGLHVDCCLGGFILPFAKKLGYSIPGKAGLNLLLSLCLDRYLYEECFDEIQSTTVT